MYPTRWNFVHAKPVDVGQHTTEERPNQAVPGIRTRRDSTVDDDRLDAELPAQAENVRPDLSLHHDEHTRAHQGERAPDDERPIEGEVEDGVGVRETAARDLLARDRRCRDKKSEPRIPGLQIRGEGPGGQRLADRDRMNPDRLFAIDVECNREKSEALAEAADVFLIPNRLIQKVGRHDDKEREREDAVDGVHEADIVE